ncbi:MAG: DUF4407 domain-containing protein [Bacteroidota bacterium]
MTTILKIFSALFQYDYEQVKRQPTLSKQKIVTLGSLLLIPVGLWAFSGFYLSHSIMGMSILSSLITALVLGGLILVIDRSFIASPRTRHKGALGVIRFAFALFATVLGSLAVDMALFSGDLEEYRQAKATDQKVVYATEYKDKHQADISRLLEEKQQAEAVHAQLREIHRREMDGEGGTGLKGFGKVAIAKGLEKDKAAAKVAKLDEEYKTAVRDLEAHADQYGEEMSAKRDDALMSKFKDLHEYVFSDSFTTGLYVFFFGFVLLIECFFMLYKQAVSETIYERFLQAEEDYAQEQLDAYSYAKFRSAQDIRVLGDDHDRIKKLLGSRRKTG